MAFCIGVKIQARNEYFMNPCVPSRDEIRKINYLRRRAQLNSEGFHSKIWKPYIDIGHPLELDKKLEVKVSLSSQEKSDVIIDDSRSTADVVKQIRPKIDHIESGQRKEMGKFQQLERTFKKEIKKSDDINFNVRVGQSFFGLMQKEKNDKIAEIEQQKMKKEISAPEYDTESEPESEFLTSVDGDQSRSTTAASMSRLKLRPFTPVYNNISSMASRATSRPKSVHSASVNVPEVHTCDIDEASLYRQLCSLHWLLRAMVHDDAVNMPRISLSWTVKSEINKDNDLTSAKNRMEIKNTWDKFVFKSISSIDPVPKEQESGSKVRKLVPLSAHHRPMKGNSVVSVDLSINNDLQTTALVDDTHPSASTYVPSRPVRKLSISAAATADNTSRATSSKASQRRQLFVKMRSVCDELDKEDNYYNDRENQYNKSRIGKVPTVNYRTPQSTKLMPEDCFSDKLEDMVRRNRVKSAQLIDERMAELRENVKNMSEYKLIVCHNKFKDVQYRGPFHQMLKEFRYKNDYNSFFAALDASKNKIIYANWFLLLEDFLKVHVDNKRIQDILSDIRQYALITVTKINKNRLLSVLKTLTDWEIRHPEVSASIKFITDQIVVMPDEEYQQWFTKTF